ncbi:MAG TPA: 3'-5' exonuclease, partial [Polyangiaceae bacterium]|nr:3'-5' exonuclease [Polyangiaceae bacterium]
MMLPASLPPAVSDPKGPPLQPRDAPRARLSPPGHAPPLPPPDEGEVPAPVRPSSLPPPEPPRSECDTPPSPYADEGPDSVPGAFLAFVDCETTGLLPEKHEVLEIAVVRADARTLAVLDECSVKVRPERIEDADPEALAVCGYDPAAWRDAVPLAEALVRVTPLLEGATLAGHGVSFDQRFLQAAYRKAGVRPPSQPRHLLDTASLGWP